MPVRLACSLCLLAATVTGCAGLSPVVAGDGYLGLGLFRDRRPHDAASPDYIDVEGVGLLIAKGRIALGYAQLCYVSADADSTFRLKMSGAEVALGADADAWAAELNAINEHEWLAETSREESH